MEIVRDYAINSKELNEWILNGIKSLQQQIIFIEGKIKALEEVRKGQCLDMDIAHQK